jgi:hypothetical protein
MDIVDNYQKVINGLRTRPGHPCPYYSVWVICSGGSPLPDGSDRSQIAEFLDAVTAFWHQGNAVVWWTDNDPYFYEATEWLARTDFPGDGKLQFRIMGNYFGC